MAKLNLLTVKEVEAAKPTDKITRLFDGGGLYLEIKPSGQRGWRYKFRLHGRERRMSLGPAFTVSLAKARDLRREAELLVIDGRDPVEERKNLIAAERAKQDAKKLTFKSLVWDWSERWHTGKEAKPATVIRNERLIRYLEKDLGGTPVFAITRQAVLNCVERIQDDNGVETAHRALTFCHLFCEHLVIKGVIPGDPTVGIKQQLGKAKDKPRAAIIDEKGIGHLLRSIWNYEGYVGTVAALKILAHTFLRSSELRKAKWSEIDLEDKMWIIPAERMTKRKYPNAHYVPLTTQTIKILSELREVTGGKDDDYVFPTVRKGRFLSENAFKVALANMGFTGDQMTPHGFRKTAATQLASLGYPRHLIRMQSGRCDSSVEGVYNLYEYGPERRKMMRQWSKHLDQLRKGANVVAIGKKQTA